MPAGIEVLLNAADIRAAWDGLTVNQRRSALQVLGVEVVLKPARGGPGFKADSIDINWAHG